MPWVKKGAGKLGLPAEGGGSTPERRELGCRRHRLPTGLSEGCAFGLVMSFFIYRRVSRKGGGGGVYFVS